LREENSSSESDSLPSWMLGLGGVFRSFMGSHDRGSYSTTGGALSRVGREYGWERVGVRVFGQGNAGNAYRLDSLSGIVYNTIVKKRRVVLDTNVVLAALRSRRGASFKLLSLLAEGRFEIAISVPLLLEYEDVLGRHITAGLYGQQDIDDFLDYVCQVAHRQNIFFLWRPCLPDPKDDMVLELAVAAGCEAIVTYNQRDFVGADRLGLRADAPRDFLRILEEPS
jgi:putative PIN family toxin of toxin-antitoxin system